MLNRTGIRPETLEKYMSVRSALLALAIATTPMLIAVPSACAEAPIYTGRFNNLAVQGFDPVTYFTLGELQKGLREFSTRYMGAEFRFVSQDNLDTFLSDPMAYAPQYGGYCAWAMADGKFAKGDARRWNIVDGKLYLNYNKSIQEKWLADIPGFIARADRVWPEVRDQ